MKSAQPILFLFAASLVFYGFFHVPNKLQNFRGMIIKCLPIVLLQVFVARHGLSSRDNYGHRILAGIVLSSIGDAFLDFPGFFLHGTVAFLVAHLCFISAFGFSPLKLGIGVAVVSVLSLPYLLVIDALTKLEGLSSVVLPLYGLVLKTMVWRAIVKASSQSEFDKAGHDWAKISAGIGAIFFAISDSAIAIDKFYQPFNSQMFIMATYYIAMLLIALSVFHKRPSTKNN